MATIMTPMRERDDRDILAKFKSQYQRSNSINFGNTPDKSLKFLGSTVVSFPRRERFNEDTDKVIQEIKEKTKEKHGALVDKNMRTLGKGEEKSQRPGSRHTANSKSLTKSELSQFFIQKSKQIEEEVKSRLSNASKGFKSKFLNRIQSPIPQLNKAETSPKNEQEATADTEQEKEDNQKVEEIEVDIDKSIATSVVEEAHDLLSNVPTE